MLFRFPDSDTLQLAITSGLVPAEVAAGPAVVSRAGDAVVVETAVKVPKKVRVEWEKLGAVEVKHHAEGPADVSCWPQILPVTRSTAPPQQSSQAPVLFELPAEAELTAVVTELLRLGNDRQSFRRMPGGRVQLRVVGPPYYTLLRAIDRATLGGEVRAYAEAAPRVWVELGFAHPLADRIAVAEGQSLLIRAPRDWEYLADGPFRDVYDQLNLQLPARPVTETDAGVVSTIRVPVRLVPGNAADEPEFWVISGDPLDRLDAFVRDADNRLVRRLRFAVAASSDGTRSAILRVAPSKLAPPPLALADAVGYRSYWKLPNLFVPAGTRLHPPLRRDAVRTLLAPDPDAVVWLHPDGAGGFTPRSIPDAAFRKLDEWVEYVIDRERELLSVWVASATFAFDPFVCGEGVKPPSEPAARERRPDRPERPKKDVLIPEPERTTGEAVRTIPGKVPKPTPPSEWKERRTKLEAEFLAVDGPLDHPDRVKLWPELAAANAGAENAAEAAACWSHALWQTDAPAVNAKTWAAADVPGLPFPISAAAFDARFAPADPTLAEARQAVAVLLAAAIEKPEWLPSRLPAVRSFLVAHDAKLPARIAWLAAVALASLSGTDVLGLARARDRLLTRLYESGLNPERDLPAFLRFAGTADADRVREVRESANDLHGLVKGWLAKSLTDTSKDTTATPAYADLLFAYAFAKFGDATRARELIRAATGVLDGPPPAGAQPHWATASSILGRAFIARIEQVLAGVPPVGPLPKDVTDDIAEHLKLGKGIASSPHSLAHYVIARMREQSTVLEPHEQTDPKLQWSIQADELKRQLVTLPMMKAEVLPREVRRLLDVHDRTRPDDHIRFEVLLAALPLAPRAGEAFTVELLKIVPDAMAGADPAYEPARQQGRLLERALFLAGHFGRADLVTRLVDRFLALVAAQKDEAGVTALVNAATGSGLRSLRKLGQSDAVDRMLARLFAEVARGESVDRLRVRHAAKPKVWYEVLQSLLRLAGGWLTFGLVDRAAPAVDAARAELLNAAAPGLPANSTPDLVRAYVAALGQGPAAFGLPRLRELFQAMPPNRIANSWTTAPVYSLNHVRVVEEVVLALTGDEYAAGATARRWLDEDEHLVRRRVHADVRRLVAGAGL